MIRCLRLVQGLRRYRKQLVTGSALFFCLLYFWLCLPGTLFHEPYSTVLLDRNGQLLGASIADDGQWRFPPRSSVPEQFAQALVLYEDRRFHAHPGVDPLALARAIRDNIRAGEVVSGASTITMQVIRLSRKNSNRTVWEKLVEMVFALRLDLTLSKDEILALFASHAPFGGNVVGLDAAAWRYFAREPEKLSWAEHAMLAVLPNDPALIHPGRNRELLLEKRNGLLDLLCERGVIDERTCSLAKDEPLPPKPHLLPMLAPHLLARVRTTERVSTRVVTTLERAVQAGAAAIVARHSERLAGGGIHNAAALILDTRSGEVLAYVGNSGDFSGGEHGNQVDLITARRSTGSILKPLLYAALVETGEMLPGQLVPDIPARYGSFMPKNYSRSYEGAVPAYRVLAASLNVPAVHMLSSFGVDRYLGFLKRLGMSTLHRTGADYGLSLILGGAEGTLWELTGIYASLARSVLRYPDSTLEPVFHAPVVLRGELPGGGAHREESIRQQQGNPLSPGACWLTLKAMVDAERPGVERGWREYGSSQKIAWKTGTSYGYRDAWAIGVTPHHAIGVWVGNADGAGRPGLIGTIAAAPLLFDLFDLFERSVWFEEPASELVFIEVCTRSGYRAGPHCEESEQLAGVSAGFRAETCPYCRRIHLDSSMDWQVNSSCEAVWNMRVQNRFVLPPAMEYFYEKRHSDYRPLPPFREDCRVTSVEARHGSISIIYPHRNSRIYVPLEMDGNRGRTVFQAAHRDRDSTIYWHLDSRYLGYTRDLHRMSVSPAPGRHLLTLVDDRGGRVQRSFVILSVEVPAAP
jgi:penicillin-binding protein 1C